jgi:hypothetical protein
MYRNIFRMCSRSVAIIYKKGKVDIFNNEQVMELFPNSGTYTLYIQIEVAALQIR